MDQVREIPQPAGAVVDALNQARGLELNAIMQYMNHHYNLENMDFGELAMNLKLIAIDEMRHAEIFAERVEELGGQPSMERAGRPRQGEEVRVLLHTDEKLEEHAIRAYNGFLKLCLENGDSVSARIFEEVIGDEQLHFNYFQNTGGHAERLGEVYLARIAGTPSSTGIRYQGFAQRQGGPPAQGGG